MPAMVTSDNLSASTRHWLQLEFVSLPQTPTCFWWEGQPCQTREMATFLKRAIEYLQEA
jgi:uncharacterized protein involved in tolerance to divalent cations